ncbi:MAG: branched-chain amino acid transaminase [Desulfovibrionaceae bacterium]|nr:branched-chain amino acid transaminase [Desulfovibrionaceae bacterium]
MPALEPTPFIWFNGKLVPWNEAQVHVLSHALHYGTSYFEGIRAYRCPTGGSAVFRLKDHMRRFVNSGKILGLPCPWSQADLEKAVIDTLTANKMETAYIRPLAFVGYGSMGVLPPEAPLDVIIAVWSWGAYLGAEGMDKGVRVKTSSFSRIHPNTLMSKAKAGGNYVNSVLAKVEAVKCGYDEALMLDVQGFVSEASGENIFIVRGNTLKTTPLTSVLEGISRDSIIKLARDMGYTVEEQLFTRDELYCADEAFFCGTAAEVTPIREVDNRIIGEGHAGSVTKSIQRAFFQVVDGSSAKYADWLAHYSF